jgi:hypothetical protein
VEAPREPRADERASGSDVHSERATNEDSTEIEVPGERDDTDLFEPGEHNELERRWNEIQGRFVDEPRGSVEEANELVAELMERLVSSFSEQRAGLEQQWDRGEDVTTEDLRIAFQRYRSFFGRLLAVSSGR